MIDEEEQTNEDDLVSDDDKCTDHGGTPDTCYACHAPFGQLHDFECPRNRSAEASVSTARRYS